MRTNSYAGWPLARINKPLGNGLCFTIAFAADEDVEEEEGDAADAAAFFTLFAGGAPLSFECGLGSVVFFSSSSFSSLGVDMSGSVSIFFKRGCC
jgi:hypothetical protein